MSNPNAAQEFPFLRLVKTSRRPERDAEPAPAPEVPTPTDPMAEARAALAGVKVTPTRPGTREPRRTIDAPAVEPQPAAPVTPISLGFDVTEPVQAEPVPLPTQAVPEITTKVTLDADRPMVKVGGDQASKGSMIFTLGWDAQPATPGGVKPSTDVHLGCLYQLMDGTEGVLQLLDDRRSAMAPMGTLLRLNDRSEREGQPLHFGLPHAAHLKRFHLFAYGINRTPDWANWRVSLGVNLRHGGVLEMFLGDGVQGTDVAVLASVHRVKDLLVIRREGEFLAGQQQAAAEAYGYSLNWVNGRTLPTTKAR